MELRIRSDRPEDRLVTAVFVAALVHGIVILGVKFSAPPPRDAPLPTLEVLLVPDGPNERANEDAAYLAQRNQHGSGTGRERQRTSLPESTAALIEHEGVAGGQSLEDAASAADPGGAQVLAAETGRTARTTAGADAPPTYTALPIDSRVLAQIGANATASDADLHLRGERPTDDRLLADTRESVIASYLDGWKRRIERVGTLNFPDAARRAAMSGNPVLEVAIRADGTLEEVLVRRSSGHRELDVAAVRIVRLASPFDPFPRAMRERYPVLRFAYEWQFLEGRLGDGAVFGEP
ncbi:MAG: TonB family protein [Steroidobacteraceae bacterium]